jgi:phage shock protein A
MAGPNPIVKAWRYLTAWGNNKIDEKADPKVQIQQAITEAQTQHEALTRQAANVIGNQRQLEMKLDRQLDQVEQLQAQARQALVLADKSRAEGDEVKAGQFESTAQTLASQLVTTEASVNDLKQLHDQALQAAGQAREAVQNNAMLLQQKLAERTKLLSQLEQAKMQEQVSASLSQMSELAAPSNTPSLEEVRDKIERRYSTALGQADLAQNSVEGRMLEVRRATMDMAGSARLEEIRASLGTGVGGTGSTAITSGTPAAAPVIDTQKQEQPGV